MKSQSIVRAARGSSESDPGHLATQSIAKEALAKGDDHCTDRRCLMTPRGCGREMKRNKVPPGSRDITLHVTSDAFV